MKKATVKKHSQLEIIGRLMIIERNASDIAFEIQLLQGRVFALAEHLKNLRQDLRIKIEFK